MKYLVLLLLFFIQPRSSLAQDDEKVFVVKAIADKTSEPDTNTIPSRVEIFWTWKAPLYDGQQQTSIVHNFSGYPGNPFTYRDSSLGDTLIHNYESMDVSIALGKRVRTYHSPNNRITQQMSTAFKRMLLGTTLTFQLHRAARHGENRTETLVYHIVSFAKGMIIKRANSRKTRTLGPNYGKIGATKY